MSKEFDCQFCYLLAFTDEARLEGIETSLSVMIILFIKLLKLMSILI
jgi:hypothetical protein